MGYMASSDCKNHSTTPQTLQKFYIYSEAMKCGLAVPAHAHRTFPDLRNVNLRNFSKYTYK